MAALIWLTVVGATMAAFALHAIYKFNRGNGIHDVFGYDHDEIYYNDNDIEEDED